MDNNPELPEVIASAIPNAILKMKDKEAFESIPSLKNRVELWIDSSWKIAENLGLKPEDYVEWMMLGEWNLAGSSETLNMVSSYTALAGRESWALKKANISIEAAVEMSISKGLDSVIEDAKVMHGLYKLMPESEGNPKSEAKKEEPKDYTINFPSNY